MTDKIKQWFIDYPQHDPNNNKIWPIEIIEGKRHYKEWIDGNIMSWETCFTSEKSGYLFVYDTFTSRLLNIII